MAQTWKATPAKLAAIGALDWVGERALRPLASSTRSRTPPDPRSVKKILVTELWNIGDVVLTLPFLAELRRIFPHAGVTLLAKAHAREVLEGTGLVDEHVTFDFAWTSPEAKYDPSRYDLLALMRVFRALRGQQFDLSFDCRMDARGNVVTFLAGARTRVGHAFGGATWLLTHPVSVENHSAHKAADWLRLLAPFGVDAGAESRRLHVTDEERAWAAAFIARAGIREGAKVVGVHPGGSRLEKRWPLERFAVVVQRLAARQDVQPLVFVDPTGYGTELGDLAGVVAAQPALRQLMALIQRCSLFVCNDSGPMHLAGGLGVPVVAVFGSGMAEWFSPLGHAHRVVTRRGLECRPCYGNCRYSEPFCLTRIPAAEVWAEVEAALTISNEMVAATPAGSIAS